MDIISQNTSKSTIGVPLSQRARNKFTFKIVPDANINEQKRVLGDLRKLSMDLLHHLVLSNIDIYQQLWRYEGDLEVRTHDYGYEW